MPKELVLFYVAFLTFRLYIHLDQFIIFGVTLPTLYHQVPSSFILVFKRLNLKLLKIVTLLTLKAILGNHPTRIATILTIFNSKLSRSILLHYGSTRGHGPTVHIIEQLGKRHKIIPIPWACPVFPLANFTVSLVGTNIEK